MTLPKADVTGIEALTAKLLQAPENIGRNLRQRLLDVGDVIASQAKRNARFSTKIPPTIYRRLERGTVVIRAGNKRVPIARWYELGRTNASPVWRHPTIRTVGKPRKDWKWVDQREPHRPFLVPALEENRDDAIRTVTEGIIDAINEVLAE